MFMSSTLQTFEGKQKRLLISHKISSHTNNLLKRLAKQALSNTFQIKGKSRQISKSGNAMETELSVVVVVFFYLPRLQFPHKIYGDTNITCHFSEHKLVQSLT